MRHPNALFTPDRSPEPRFSGLRSPICRHEWSAATSQFMNHPVKAPPPHLRDRDIGGAEAPPLRTRAPTHIVIERTTRGA